MPRTQSHKATFKGGHYATVGKGSKTRDPRCSAAMSAWKSEGGVLTHELATILAGCRKKASALRGTPGTGPPGKALERLQGIKARTTPKAAPVVQPEAQVTAALVPTTSAKLTSKQPVGKAEQDLADIMEKRVARWVGGTVVKGNKASDVRLNTGGKRHRVEVKAKAFGEKQGITVHPDALHRKFIEANESPDIEFHTVVVDHRNKYEGGKHKENYSGHTLYYKRGSGAYALSKMYKVKHPSELRALMTMPEDQLPEAARGSLRRTPEEIAAYAVKAQKADESRKKRQAAYDEELRAQGLTRHRKTPKVQP